MQDSGTRTRVRYFTSYPGRNKDLAERLGEALTDNLEASKTYAYQPWIDQDIVVGEDWREEIERALASCDFGLLLVSPAFLASKFIEAHELPRFVGPQSDKPVIPVMLQPIDFDRHDLKGLDRKQIFRLDRKGLKRPKAFGDCKDRQRDEFALSLFGQIEDRLSKLFAR